MCPPPKQRFQAELLAKFMGRRIADERLRYKEKSWKERSGRKKYRAFKRAAEKEERHNKTERDERRETRERGTRERVSVKQHDEEYGETLEKGRGERWIRWCHKHKRGRAALFNGSSSLCQVSGCLFILLLLLSVFFFFRFHQQLTLTNSLHPSLSLSLPSVTTGSASKGFSLTSTGRSVTRTRYTSSPSGTVWRKQE